MNRSILQVAAAAALAATTTFASHPSASRDIVDTAERAGSFQTLLAALEAADLVDALQGAGPFTVLAPTDEAFAKLPAAELDRLLLPENRDQLTAILTYHVIPGSFEATAALGAGSAATLQGEEVDFSLRNGQLFANEARVQLNDVQASNGVIHAIDSVLLPDELPAKGRLVIGVYLDSVSSALASQLGVDRGESLLVERLTKDGNASRAGVAQYDVIVRIDGQPATEESLKRAKKNRGPGGLVDLEVIRAGEHIRIHVPVGVERH